MPVVQHPSQTRPPATTREWFTSLGVVTKLWLVGFICVWCLLTADVVRWEQLFLDWSRINEPWRVFTSFLYFSSPFPVIPFAMRFAMFIVCSSSIERRYFSKSGDALRYLVLFAMNLLCIELIRPWVPMYWASQTTVWSLLWVRLGECLGEWV